MERKYGFTTSQTYGAFYNNQPIVQEYSDPVYSYQYDRQRAPIYSDRETPPGLDNIGNTCFLNSVLQCLFHTPQISNFFLSDHFKLHLNKATKHARLAEMFQILVRSSKEGNFRLSDIEEFKLIFEKINENFLGYEQQDSQEFLRLFVDNLHEAFNKKAQNFLGKKPQDYKPGLNEHQLAKEWWEFNMTRDQSPIFNIFAGQFISSIVCPCGNESKCFENFLDLSLSFKTSENKYTIDWESQSPVDLSSLLDQFMQREMIVSKCDKCKQTNQKSKGLRFSRLPDVLCIHIKRFEYCDGYRRKIKRPVNFPKERLDLKNYYYNPLIRGTSVYDLIGVIKHYGEVNYGHYIAECKNGKTWFCFDDSKVKYSEINGGMTEVQSSEAYILFYQKSKY